jgi:hypothetical protein
METALFDTTKWSSLFQQGKLLVAPVDKPFKKMWGTTIYHWVEKDTSKSIADVFGDLHPGSIIPVNRSNYKYPIDAVPWIADCPVDSNSPFWKQLFSKIPEVSFWFTLGY